MAFLDENNLPGIGKWMKIPGDDYHGSGFNPVVIGWDGVEIPVIIGY